MLKKFCLWGALGLFVLGVAPGILGTWLGRAAEANRGVGVWEVNELDELELRFINDQNTLVLEFLGEATHQAYFSLVKIDGGGRIVFTYETAFRADLAYPLAAGSADNSSTDNCGVQPSITVDIGEEEDRGSRLGYDQKWENYDIDQREDVLQAQLQMPIRDTATATAGDCFVLEQAITLDNRGSKPLFSVTGERNNSNDCGGLRVYGRGGNDLDRPAAGWLCHEDHFLLNRSLSSDDLSKLTDVDRPPFGRHYIFIENVNGDACGSRLLVNADELDNHHGSIDAQWQDWHDDCGRGQYDSDKNSKKTVLLGVDNNTEAYKEHLATTGETGEINRPLDPVTQPTTPSGTTTAPEPDCSLAWSGFGVGYVICWVLEGLTEGIQGIEQLVYNFLTLEEDEYKEPIQGQGANTFTYKSAWRTIRDFMSFAIVGTALFMIIATALNIGFFSNYTVKKYLPRLVVGTILIQFSWTLGDFMIQFTNQLGDLVHALVFASFPEAEDFGLNSLLDGGLNTLLLGGTVGAATGVAIALNWTIILPVLLSGFLAFLFGFMFLIARKYIIIMSLILAPLGLAFWILPGNDRAWRFYSKIFLYSLLFYPIIKLILGFAKVFAYVVASDTSNPVALIVAFLIYIGGFLAIPFAAKSFSGALGQLTGMINDRSKGLVDRPRKALKDWVGERGQGRASARWEKNEGQTPFQRLARAVKRGRTGGSLRDPERQKARQERRKTGQTRRQRAATAFSQLGHERRTPAESEQTKSQTGGQRCQTARKATPGSAQGRPHRDRHQERSLLGTAREDVPRGHRAHDQTGGCRRDRGTAGHGYRPANRGSRDAGAGSRRPAYHPRSSGPSQIDALRQNTRQRRQNSY